MHRVHFVGIGGIGMSAIAELLAAQGYDLSGSDVHPSEVTVRLATLGIKVHDGHDAAHVGDADVVVISSAIRPSNPEVVEATRRGVPVVPRGEMLAALMRQQEGVAIGGAHGKTTTTAMIALVLERAGLDPTAIIGGRVGAFGGNARLGRGAYMVVEADESDRSFLLLAPTIAVITNVDREHLENYGTFDNLLQAFVRFANSVPFHGAAVLCLDNPAVRAMRPKIARRVISYGLDADAAEFTADQLEQEAFGVSGRVLRRVGRSASEERLGRISLQIPGRHNLQNALAAVAVAFELGIPFDTVAAALADFRGAERRFQLRGEAGGVLVVDDYGHHPTEILAVIEAARSGLKRRVVVVFQPHRYSRTIRLLDEFGAALSGADEIVLTEIYAASEDPIPGATVDAIASAVRRLTSKPVHVVRDLKDVPGAVCAIARPGDLVITLGAGSIGTIGERILDELKRRPPDSGARP